MLQNLGFWDTYNKIRHAVALSGTNLESSGMNALSSEKGVTLFGMDSIFWETFSTSLYRI